MNAEAIQEFLFRHVEKFVFGALTILALFLIYQGVQKPDIGTTQQPEKMEQSAKQVKTSIEDDHWAAIKEPRLPTFNIVDRTKESTKPVDPKKKYDDLTPWDPDRSENGSLKRTDPKLPEPIDVQVRGVLASLAMKSAGDYPIGLLERADAVKKDEKKLQPKKKDPPRARAGGAMAMDEASMAEYMSQSMNSSNSSMASPMAGLGAAGPGTPRRSISAKLNLGYVPVVGPKPNVAPAVGWFIAGVALMPQKEIFAAFEKAFSEAEGYNLNRDQPYYLGFQLQRADVTAKSVDQLVVDDWKPRGTSRYYQQLLLKRWSGMAKEIVAPKYRDPELTAAIPPVLLDHYAWFATHPRIPVGDELLPGATAIIAEPELPVGPIIPDAGDDTFNQKGRTGANPMSGMDMNQFGNFNNIPKVDQPEFKLIRFYDFHDFSGGDTGSPQPGRKYVYRIRIAVEDPNFPVNVAYQPRTSTMSAEVFRRVEKLIAQSVEVAKTNPQKPRNSSLWSDYSAASPPVSLPGLYETFVGPVDPGTTKVFQVGSESIEFNSKPPKAKVVVAQWNPTYGVRLPVFLDAVRGQIINKVGTIDVPDPIAMEVKKLPDATVNTGNVVLDMSGGKLLNISPAENQTEPGVVLMFDPSGGLEVVDEIETQHNFRLYSYADEREAP